MKYPPVLILLLFFFFSSLSRISAQDDADDGNAWSAAMQAQAKGDFQAYRHHMSDVIRYVGPQPNLLYALAAAHARVGDAAATDTTLRRLLAFHLPFDLAADTAFAALPDRERWIAAFGAFQPKAFASQIAFQLADSTLIPEGITYDARQRAFYIGSLARNKVVKVDKRGRVTDFTTPGADSLQVVLGMKVDPGRRRLWVCTASRGNDWSGLFAYDLKTGKLLKKYTTRPGTGRHLFNDLALAADGTIYVTDSEGGAVYRLRPGADTLDQPFAGLSLIYPNGLALSADDQRLYVAQFAGIAVLEPGTGKQQPLIAPDSLSGFGFDGLYRHGASLVGIQNGIGRERIVRLDLAPDGRSVTGGAILDAVNPHWKIPTTGVLVGDRLYYIANSQLRRLRDDGSLAEPETLERPRVMWVGVSSGGQAAKRERVKG